MKLYPDDWPVRLVMGLTSAACIAAAMIFWPAFGIHGFWPDMVAVVVAVIIGNLLGALLCRRLFRPSK
jgi:hypothetical protein